MSFIFSYRSHRLRCVLGLALAAVAVMLASGKVEAQSVAAGRTSGQIAVGVDLDRSGATTDGAQRTIAQATADSDGMITASTV